MHFCRSLFATCYVFAYTKIRLWVGPSVVPSFCCMLDTLHYAIRRMHMCMKLRLYHENIDNYKNAWNSCSGVCCLQHYCISLITSHLYTNFSDFHPWHIYSTKNSHTYIAPFKMIKFCKDALWEKSLNLEHDSSKEVQQNAH